MQNNVQYAQGNTIWIKKQDRLYCIYNAAYITFLIDLFIYWKWARSLVQPLEIIR